MVENPGGGGGSSDFTNIPEGRVGGAGSGRSMLLEKLARESTIFGFIAFFSSFLKLSYASLTPLCVAIATRQLNFCLKLTNKCFLIMIRNLFETGFSIIENDLACNNKKYKTIFDSGVC